MLNGGNDAGWLIVKSGDAGHMLSTLEAKVMSSGGFFVGSVAHPAENLSDKFWLVKLCMLWSHTLKSLVFMLHVTSVAEAAQHLCGVRRPLRRFLSRSPHTIWRRGVKPVHTLITFRDANIRSLQKGLHSRLFPRPGASRVFVEGNLHSRSCNL